MQERIQKVLGNAGVASRRNIEEMVQQGRISVNGKIVTELPVMIDPEVDRVEVDHQFIRLRTRHGRQRIYIIMNKPRGVHSTNVAQGEQVRAIDLLPQGLPGRVYPVGRLDAESKGLLLLSNDGELANRLTHPRYGVPKTYRAVVDGYISADVLEEMRAGIWLADPRTGKGFKTGRSRIKLIKRHGDKSILEITIREGRNRQIRRMLAKLGHKVRDLTRVAMGPLTLDGIAPGKFRPLTRSEIAELKRSVEPASSGRRRDEGTMDDAA